MEKHLQKDQSIRENDVISAHDQIEDFGFIILRHVNSARTDKYWKYCYDCIRKFYPENKILVIDDGSKSEFVTIHPLHKTKIIETEFRGRGELLPYYYYLTNKEFKTALIIHDSVFIKKKVDLSVDNYKILWSFEHKWDQIKDETEMINIIDDAALKEFYQNKSLWKGCFGAMCIITHDYLVYLDNKYHFSKLLNHITTKYNRCSFERVLACMLQKDGVNTTLFGDIHQYVPWNLQFERKDEYDLPFVKVWSGR